MVEHNGFWIAIIVVEAVVITFLIWVVWSAILGVP